MATEVKIPAMGESITSGILAAWHVKDGDYVEAGQALFELETDKISSEGLAEVAGTVSLKAAEGDEVEIGQVVAEIDESAKAPAKSETPTKDSAPKEEKAPEPAPTKSSGKQSEALSPAARRVATEKGVDPKTVQGTGKDGRVTKGDLLKAKPAKAAAKQSAEERQTRKKMTPLRKKIAERLVMAQQEAAMLTTFNEVNMEPIMSLRKKYQEEFVAAHGVKLGFMSFFVKAVVHALQEIPGINAQIDGDCIIQNHYYDIGIAIGAPKGLVVPVVRDCDQLEFHEIEQAIIDYAQKAKGGKLTMEDMEGGVFTITNGGTYGSMLSTPILNAPQSAILGMHNIVQRPVVIDGEIVVRPIMYLALTYDHRIVDGKEAVTFLVNVKNALEDPVRSLFSV